MAQGGHFFIPECFLLLPFVYGTGSTFNHREPERCCHIARGGTVLQVKKPATYREQVEALQKKGLVIQNEHRCEQFLQRVTYYRFSAYLYPFRQTADRHIENVTFERVYEIYEFDRKIRALLLQVMEEIELMLRSQLSYYHVHKYGELGYMRAECFNKNHRHRQFLRLVEDVVEDNKTDAIVRHHQEKYDGLFPLWW